VPSKGAPGAGGGGDAGRPPAAGAAGGDAGRPPAGAAEGDADRAPAAGDSAHPAAQGSGPSCDPEAASADPGRARPSRGELLAVTGITALAAALRFTRIGHQSFWLDESYTVDLVTRPFGDMLSGVAHTESTPPLYYVLAWLWAKLFGTTEAGLRSLSGLFGTIAVPVAWQAAREWFRRPAAGLIAAALVAVNPFFVWYSQEARSYSLLILTAALTILTLGRALSDRTPRAYAGWAAAAAAALLTHYFAAFLVAPEAIWLIWATRRGTGRPAAGGPTHAAGPPPASRDRRAWLAAAVPAAVAVALAPLAIGQRDLGHTSFIAGLSLRSRVIDLPKKLVTGELGTPTPLIGPIAGLIAAAAIAYAVHRFRTPALTLLALAAAAAGIPLALALLGADYLLPRNVIAAYVPLTLVAAAGLAAAPRNVGAAGAAVIAAVAIVVNAEVATDPKLERDDWRGAANQLATTSPGTAILVTPDYQEKPLRLYAESLPTVPAAGTRVTQLDAIAIGRPPRTIPPPPPGFTERERVATPSYVLVRYRAPAATTVTPAQFPGAALLQPR
jgi:mannosyltransferase